MIETEGDAEILDLMKACEAMIKDAKTQNEWVEKLIQGDFFATVLLDRIKMFGLFA